MGTVKPEEREERLVLPSNMALKALLVLATIGFVYSQSHCSAFEDGTNDGRDCSCADRSFGECSEWSTIAQFPVVNLEECQARCSAWSRCGWLIFDRSGSEHLNCKMFAWAGAPMSGYLNSCNMDGGPLRNEQDNCLGDLTDTYCGNANFCPGGCASCAADRCNDFAETECVVTSPEIATAIVSYAVDCQAVMTAQGLDAIINYFTYDNRAMLCKGYSDGQRSCDNVVAAKNMDIQSCQTWTQRL